MDNKDLNNLNSSAPQKVQPSVQSGSASSDLEALKQRWPANSAEGLCVRRYGDRESFLKNFNPGRQNELCHPRYVDFIFCGVAPELGVVERAYGRPCLESWLMIQLADLGALALRRYFENGETDLLDRIKPRFDTRHGKIVGVRHFTRPDCPCILCQQA